MKTNSNAGNALREAARPKDTTILHCCSTPITFSDLVKRTRLNRNDLWSAVCELVHAGKLEIDGLYLVRKGGAV
ncbi:MAG: hypothetical protein J7539_13310 [Niabella sp.]|nr:hypothetical protein [Niabella sp.]